MGLMMSRRRASAAKEIQANKAKAHAANHKAALAKHAKELEGHQSQPQSQPAKVEDKKDGSDKLGSK